MICYTYTSSMWYRKRQYRKKRASTVTKHYLEHKDMARALVHERLGFYNRYYGFAYNRVSIKNQKRCWGSCSSLKNLNFSYKVLFLPPCLRDYIIVHELCHLREMNHGADFWKLVEERIPDYKRRVKELKAIEKSGVAVPKLQEVRTSHNCAICAEEF